MLHTSTARHPTSLSRTHTSNPILPLLISSTQHHHHHTPSTILQHTSPSPSISLHHVLFTRQPNRLNQHRRPSPETIHRPHLPQSSCSQARHRLPDLYHLPHQLCHPSRPLLRPHLQNIPQTTNHPCYRHSNLRCCLPLLSLPENMASPLPSQIPSSGTKESLGFGLF